MRVLRCELIGVREQRIKDHEYSNLLQRGHGDAIRQAGAVQDKRNETARFLASADTRKPKREFTQQLQFGGQ